MTTETLLTEEQLICQTTDALIDKLGLMEATRFLRLKHQGRMDRGTASVMAKRAG